MPEPTVARLSTSSQLVAAVPLYLGYTPTESLVVACCHEPRGRLGLTMRYDLPPAEHLLELVADVVRRVRRQHPTRLLIAVYSEAEGSGAQPWRELVEEIVDAVPDLRITDAVLVRAGRFWSYLCEDARCCPAAGTPVDDGAQDEPIRLLAAEQVLRGKVTLPSRDAVAQLLTGPAEQELESAAARCARHLAILERAWEAGEVLTARSQALRAWDEALARFAEPPGTLDPDEAAALAVSLTDRMLRDALLAEREPEDMLPVLAELCRRTPDAFAAPVCTAYAWVAHCDGGGADVSIALQRALRSDPDYALAGLLAQLVDHQVDPQIVRRLTREAFTVVPAARRKGQRSPRSRGSTS